MPIRSHSGLFCTRDTGSDPFVGEELHDIEQVTRMLAIHRGDQFATIDIFHGRRRKFQIGKKKVLGSLCSGSYLDRVKSATHHEVGFDLHLNATTTDKQFGFARIGGGGVGLEPVRLQALGSLSKSFGDRVSTCVRGSV